MTTEQIIQGCHQNDRKCQRLLYEKCFPVLIKTCSRYLCVHDEAVECMNIVFMKVLKNLNKLKNEEMFFGWVKQIAITTAIDYLRQNQRFNDKHKLVLDTEYGGAFHAMAYTDQTENKLHTKEIFKLIQELPEVTRQVLNLFAIDGFSHKEIADMLNLSEEASRWHLHKARKLMQEKLINSKTA